MKKFFNLILFFSVCLLLCFNFNSITDFVVKIAESDGLPTSYTNNIESSLISEEDVITLADSKYTGDKYNFDNKNYIYYSMLKDNQKSLYRQIYANAIELENNFKPVITINIKEVKNAFEALLYDHPELFWLSNTYSYKYTKDNNCVQITINFNFNKNNIEQEKAKFNQEVNRIVNSAKKYKTDYEKELYVHNYLINNIDYTNISSLNQSAYSAIVNKKSVCAGYSKAFQLIMRKLNISAYYVVGYANTDHAWNIIKINNKYYNVDLTWNDTGSAKDKYFNVSDNFIRNTHTRLGLSKNLPRCY